MRQVEASLTDLTRAAAAALAPPSAIDSGGAIALPAPGLPIGARQRDYRSARRRGWSPRRRKRFATRFVPAATLVVSAAVTLPSLLTRDDRATRISIAPLTTPALPGGDVSPLGTAVTAARAGTAAADAVQEPGNQQTLRVVQGAALATPGALESQLLDANPQAPSAAASVATEPAAPRVEEPRYEQIRWRDSSVHGVPYSGHLHEGVRLPIKGRDWISWDPARDQVPNRAWRMYGSDKLVRTIVRVARAHRAANPTAPPLLVGDLSRKGGGQLDQHVSHQNGLDVDIYYPRLDGKPTEPTSTSQIDLALAQDLVDRFVAAGAQFVFVGYTTPLKGPSGLVQAYPNHENHMHVRLRP